MENLKEDLKDAQKENKWLNSEWGARRKEELTMIYLNHSVNDTSEFIAKSKEIAINIGFTDEKLVKIQLAAWYFDIGCSELTKEGECALSEEAASYLAKMNIDPKNLVKFERINNQLYDMELNENEKILHDAELLNLADERKLNRNSVLRGIVKRKFGYEFSDTEWLELIYRMLSQRNYLTEYAIKKYEFSKVKLTDNILHRIQQLKKAS